MSPGVDAVTIIGGGPVGTLTALLFARRGARVRVLERRPDPRSGASERGRSINLALAARGIAALERAGLMIAVTPLLLGMRGRMLHDPHGTLQFLPYGQHAGEIIYAVSREALNRTLIEAAAAHPGIELVFDARCLDVDPSAGRVQWRCERRGQVQEEDFGLLLGADGAGSAVRAAMSARGFTRATEAPLAHDYRELDIPRAPGAVGAAGFALAPDALHIWPRGGFMLIALPNLDGSFTATLFLPRSGAVSFEALGTPGAIVEFFGREFPDAARVLGDPVAQFARHPQGRLGTLYCEGWQAAERVLLLGDAAHAIVPFHGQGLNCGFEDCLVLERLLDGAPAAPAAFAQFEQARRADTHAIAAMALENYLEMRDAVRSAGFAERRALGQALERDFPGRFISRYAMVMFHPEIPYAEAQRRGARQEQVLDAVLGGAPYADAGRLLERAGL
jgi:kynurenine 3-monooxygenase